MSEATKPSLPHKDFAKRFKDVCDSHSLVPDESDGRLSYIRHQLAARYKVDVSRETVRKWYSGQTIPRNEKMRALADFLSVDYGWLAFGTKPDLDVKERPTRVLAETGTINIVAGFIQLAGGHCAIPEADDPSKYVDVYAIIGGRQRKIAVSLAKTNKAGKSVFSVPLEYDQCIVIGIVQTGPSSVDMYAIPHSLIKSVGDLVGPSVDVEFVDKQRGISISGTQISKITNISDDLVEAIRS